MENEYIKSLIVENQLLKNKVLELEKASALLFSELKTQAENIDNSKGIFKVFAWIKAVERLVLFIKEKTAK